MLNVNVKDVLKINVNVKYKYKSPELPYGTLNLLQLGSQCSSLHISSPGFGQDLKRPQASAWVSTHSYLVYLHNAYFHVPIKPEHRCFLRFAFQGQVFQYNVLPSSSPERVLELYAGVHHSRTQYSAWSYS